MNLRWLWFDYVDPQLNLTRAQRRSVRRMAYRFLRERRTDVNQPTLAKPVPKFRWIDLLAAGIPGGMMFLVLVLPQLLGRRFIPDGLQLPLYFILMWIALAAAGVLTWKPAVIHALHMHGYNVCIKCGYLQRGLPPTVTHCPECGTKRDNPLIE